MPCIPTETTGRVLTEATIENLEDLWAAKQGLRASVCGFTSTPEASANGWPICPRGLTGDDAARPRVGMRNGCVERLLWRARWRAGFSIRGVFRAVNPVVRPIRDTGLNRVRRLGRSPDSLRHATSQWQISRCSRLDQELHDRERCAHAGDPS
jgi:hypothetical protein